MRVALPKTLRRLFLSLLESSFAPLCGMEDMCTPDSSYQGPTSLEPKHSRMACHLEARDTSRRTLRAKENLPDKTPR